MKWNKWSLSSSSACQDVCRTIRGTHQILGIQGDLVPPRRYKLVVTVEDSAVHVLISPRVEEGLEPAESAAKVVQLQTQVVQLQTQVVQFIIQQLLTNTQTLKTELNILNVDLCYKEDSAAEDREQQTIWRLQEHINQ